MTDPDFESRERYRERVYEAFADRRQSLEDAIEAALSAGRERLGVELGFLTRVVDDVQRIEQTVGDHDRIRPGERCPLGVAYCRRTVELEGNLSVQDARASSSIAEAAYETFELGSYIGSRVVANGDVYGTVCFADGDERDAPFSEAEELFVELVARLVGRGIERREHERERAERTADLRAEKRRFEGIATNSFDVLFRVDTDGRFTYVSEAVERILGYEPARLLGELFTRHVTSPATADALDAFSRLLDGTAVEQFELTFHHRDGSEVVVEVNATPVVEGEDVTAIQGVGRDVTERKEREEELRVRTRAMDEAEVPITLADATEPDDPIIYVNEAFESVTGYDESEILGENLRLLQGPETDPETVATLREGIEAERPVTTELLNYRRDGSPFWNRMTITPIEDETGTVTHFLGFQQEVTERKRSEQLVGLLNRVLRHNLRNELTVIQGYAELVGDPPSDVDVGARIRRPVDRLVGLSERAHELETYAARDARPTRIDAAALLESVAAAHRERIPAATVTVENGTAPDVCAGAELERAVDELVANALAHDSAPDTTVRLTARAADGWVEITVADDGPGIPSMEAAVVEAGEETALQHGKGLGLWLVNWIVTRYGGSFQIGRQDGTVATLRLPAIEEDQPVANAARRPTVLFR
ncbi:PAS domain S-box protein [Haloarcula nitratireducens]|uniref:PAS domain S-box protein n=1 Tax=Haloarcula nitratireducens TaxID=2487749 RepID=A0AAW4PBP8_9EURY|nr:PAS domain S-box protein [Halomicroarcula nitratireducens]MBX0295596.1 PAS domain S-box protein [Halomicroarcula nitratireducens]